MVSYKLNCPFFSPINWPIDWEHWDLISTPYYRYKSFLGTLLCGAHIIFTREDTCCRLEDRQSLLLVNLTYAAINIVEGALQNYC